VVAGVIAIARARLLADDLAVARSADAVGAPVQAIA
jgi:hypothetical protein